jgi:hypothetical protein
LPTDHRNRGHCPQRQYRPDRYRERRVVVRRQVGGEDLGEIAHSAKKMTTNAVVTTLRPDLASRSTRVSSSSAFRVADRESGAHQEHEGHEAVEHSVRHQVEEHATDGDVDDNGSGCPTPDEEGFAPRREDKRSEHRLIGQLAEEDDGEGGDDDGEVHGDLFSPERRETKVPPTCTQVR